jgi:hypothetical protein
MARPAWCVMALASPQCPAEMCRITVQAPAFSEAVCSGPRAALPPRLRATYPSARIAPIRARNLPRPCPCRHPEDWTRAHEAVMKAGASDGSRSCSSQPARTARVSRIGRGPPPKPPLPRRPSSTTHVRRSPTPCPIPSFRMRPQLFGDTGPPHPTGDDPARSEDPWLGICSRT